MKLTKIILGKHVELARQRVLELEAFARKQRALVDDLTRNGWVSYEAERALAAAEADLAERRDHLENLLRTAPEMRTVRN